MFISFFCNIIQDKFKEEFRVTRPTVEVIFCLRESSAVMSVDRKTAVFLDRDAVSSITVCGKWMLSEINPPSEDLITFTRTNEVQTELIVEDDMSSAMHDELVEAFDVVLRDECVVRASDA